MTLFLDALPTVTLPDSVSCSFMADPAQVYPETMLPVWADPPDFAVTFLHTLSISLAIAIGGGLLWFSFRLWNYIADRMGW